MLRVDAAAVLRWWIAVDANVDSEEYHVRSIQAGVFRTEENALLPGWHEWQTNYEVALGGQDWRATRLSCLTTVLL